MASIRELSEEHWAGRGDLVHEHHPVHSRFPWGEEVAEGVLVYVSIASANTLDTGDGLVMLDTGGQFDADPLHAEVRKWRPKDRLAAAVFSHHHIDHVYGTAPFEREAADQGHAPPVVYGHADLDTNFDRYRRTQGWNTAINVRQFGLADIPFTFPSEFRSPDVAYRDRLTFRQGELTFELRHALGETDDATWTWVPERKVLHPGDLFIWAVPNAGNPQKVQRYVGEWATALREMAALGAEVMLAGHGLPLLGADRIRSALLDTAELLESLETQTLALMNSGASLDTVLHEVTVPEALTDRPYLQAVYDHPQFVVRNVWRRFGGWHDGEPDNLLPAPRADVAAEWVALVGGVEAVLDRARALADGGDLRLACHLVEYAVLVEPGAKEVHALRAEIYERRSEGETSSMARNLLAHAARSSKESKRDLAGGW